jgi:XTP/dITP diphosphohydrolase
MKSTKALIFASGNANKVEEVAAKMHNRFPLRGLKDVHFEGELPETSGTLEGNARQKAWHIWNLYGESVFADDTGLEVYALDGKPGVDTAFFGGPEKSAAKNKAKLISELEMQLDRRARFRTVICLVVQGKEYLFEGIVEGYISRDERGNHGFGYDPLFVPTGYSRTFAQMNMEEKNLLSHRAKAIHTLEKHLEKFGW